MLKFLLCDRYVGRAEWASQLEDIKNDENFKWVKKGTVSYLNVPVSFDIETSSFKDGLKKIAIMYVWSLNFNGKTFFGRTWEDFKELLNLMNKTFELRPYNRRVMIWIHNIEYEFQFMCRWLEWFSVFSDDARKPIYGVTRTGIEFRCSYKLSGYSLAALSGQLMTYKTEKMVGDLDYSLIRHSSTPLTAKEFGYVKQDTKVVVCYIQEQIEKEKSICDIPYTKTGYVRRFCRANTVGDLANTNSPMFKDEAWYYHNVMKSLTLTYDEYEQCKRGFQGGFTHANAKYVGKTIENVGSIDFTSSYPWIIVGMYMPMSAPIHYKVDSKERFQFLLDHFCCLFDIKIKGLVQIDRNETPLSLSRCRNVTRSIVNNGRLVQASQLETTITELDYDTLTKYYKWSSITVGNMICFRRGYLPTSFVRCVLKLYSGKTTLKDVEGREFDYLLSKGMLNSCYGMMVTDIVRSNMEYNAGNWLEGRQSPRKQIDNYNNNFGRFLYYPWGVWTTAHARHNLFSGIKAFGDDYIYSDTDSIKAKNMDKHQDYIEEYNNNILEAITKSSNFHKLPESMYRPKTIKGVEKVIGVWDYEGTYDRFKTLGAKRYLVEKNGELAFTVAGVKKASIKKYMLDTYGSNSAVFENFDDKLEIPEDYTGKLTHTYVDEEVEGNVTDYYGKVGTYHEKSYTHLEKAPFHLNIIDEFFDYITGVQHREE